MTQASALHVECTFGTRADLQWVVRMNTLDLLSRLFNRNGPITPHPFNLNR